MASDETRFLTLPMILMLHYRVRGSIGNFQWIQTFRVFEKQMNLKAPEKTEINEFVCVENFSWLNFARFRLETGPTSLIVSWRSWYHHCYDLSSLCIQYDCVTLRSSCVWRIMCTSVKIGMSMQYNYSSYEKDEPMMLIFCPSKEYGQLYQLLVYLSWFGTACILINVYVYKVCLSSTFPTL